MAEPIDVPVNRLPVMVAGLLGQVSPSAAESSPWRRVAYCQWMLLVAKDIWELQLLQRLTERTVKGVRRRLVADGEVLYDAGQGTLVDPVWTDVAPNWIIESLTAMRDGATVTASASWVTSTRRAISRMTRVTQVRDEAIDRRRSILVTVPPLCLIRGGRRRRQMALNFEGILLRLLAMGYFADAMINDSDAIIQLAKTFEELPRQEANPARSKIPSQLTKPRPRVAAPPPPTTAAAATPPGQPIKATVRRRTTAPAEDESLFGG